MWSTHQEMNNWTWPGDLPTIATSPLVSESSKGVVLGTWACGQWRRDNSGGVLGHTQMSLSRCSDYS